MWAAYLLICVLPALFFLDLLKYLVELILSNDTYSHLPLVPLVTIGLIYMERKAIFTPRAQPSKRAAAIAFAGISLAECDP